MKKIPLEDEFSDVIGKAQRGLKFSDEQLAKQAGISLTELGEITAGGFGEAAVRKVAATLGLSADALADLGAKTYYPEQPSELAGLACFNTVYGDMTVNSYLVWDPKTRVGACFDTGADSPPMTAKAKECGVKIELILLTHTHPDHIADLARLKQTTSAPAYVNRLEPVEGAEPFEAGRSFVLGGLSIETRQTSGHSVGGITYVVTGLAQPLAIVGDSIFAGSMGGGMISYQDALRNNREQILTLRNDTILCPGHGPLTTVQEEKKHNPFFPRSA